LQDIQRKGEVSFEDARRGLAMPIDVCHLGLETSSSRCEIFIPIQNNNLSSFVIACGQIIPYNLS